jgi:hypothetical protein
LKHTTRNALDRRSGRETEEGSIMDLSRTHPIRIAAVIAVAVGAGLFVTAHSEAAGGPKTYTAVATTPVLQPGSQPVGITLTNTSRNKIAFNAANLTIPAGLTVAGPVSLDPPVGTVAISGSTLELRSLNTGDGTSVTVHFTVTAQIQPTCGPRVFVSDVRQSNDFNGTLNMFALEGGDAAMSGPCSSTSVSCTAGDSTQCATGTIASPNGNTARLVVNDGDSISGTLTASVAPGALECDEYEATSDQLNFDISVTQGSATGVTKTVTFTQPQADLTKEAWEYEACFEAPYDFPALKPSELAFDFANGDFSENAVEGPAGTFTGLLLPCSAGHGVPCVASRSIDTGVVTITVDAPALDPGLRF